MIIDCHVHLLSEEGYAERLAAGMDRAGIDKACLLAMQDIPLWGSRTASNEQVMAACRAHPDRFIPFGYVDLGVDPVGSIDRLAGQGFRGLKVTRTRYPYNDDRLMEYYARAAALGLVMLFHTGTVVRVAEDRSYDVDSSRLRPVFLDRVARAFPTLTIVGAHLGNPWYEEAAMTLFWNPNVYFDLSGTLLKRKNAAWFDEVLWWTPDRMARLARTADTHYPAGHPFDRICFGTDVPIEEMGSCVEEYARLFQDLRLGPDLRERVMGGNVARMFGLA